MYTQCPDCHVAFRITATVLRQAGGRVKCGGCGNAFSALDYISEDPPDTVEDSNADVTADPVDEVIQSGATRATAEWYIEDDDSGRGEVSVGAEELTAPGVEEEAPLEARYDDSTPLPDDYGDEDDEVTPSPHSTPLTADKDDSPKAAELPVLEDAQVDLETGDPDEWLDLLDEVLDQQGAHSSGASASGQSDVNTPHSDTSNAALCLEAGEALAAIHSELSLTLDSESPDDVTEENEALETDDAPVEAGATEETIEDDSPDEDEGPELQEESEEHVEENLEAEIEPGESEDEIQDELAAVDATTEAGDDAADDASELQLAIEAEDDALEDESGDDDDARDDASDADDEEPPEADDDLEIDAITEDDESDDEFGKQIALIESSLATERDDQEDAQQDSNDDDEVQTKLDDNEAGEHDIEKELQASSQYEPADDNSQHTVNVQIHEDMRRAMDDEQFAATMTSEDGSPLIETIIMEGEFVRRSISIQEADPDSNQSADLEEHKSLLDTYVLSRSKGKGKNFLSGSGAGMTASVVILILVLAGQYIHTSREFLATYGMFNQTIGPVYRVLGNPVVPAWDIKGWQFETTNGRTDEGEQLLTIYSSISNRSNQALPYPLVHVSLTDRWQEIIGSRVLEPNEYLAGSSDPRTPVAAGDNFTAVISIASLAEEVTGFNLNVCYRLSPGRLSCAIDDFKN